MSTGRMGSSGFRSHIRFRSIVMIGAFVAAALAPGSAIGASKAVAASAKQQPARAGQTRALTPAQKALVRGHIVPYTPRKNYVANSALILADSVSGSPSLEEAQAVSKLFTVTVVSDATWMSMTTAQFRAYQVLIIGDATCPDFSGGGAGESFHAADPGAGGNGAWKPAVMKSGGARVIIGTDPTFHDKNGAGANQKVLEADGIAYAGSVAGATGAYVDLSCTYSPPTPNNTGVPLLDGLSAFGSGKFTVGGAPCAGSISLIAKSGPTASMTDADLSDWSCSVHEYFNTWAADYTPLALATDPAVPDVWTGVDVDTGGSVHGSPYILASGGGLITSSCLNVTPGTATNAIFSAHTVKATFKYASTAGGACDTPITKTTITWKIVTGPNLGKSGTCVTDASGQCTFTYTGTGGLGRDTISAKGTDPSSGATEEGLAYKDWVLPISISKTGIQRKGTIYWTITWSNIARYPVYNVHIDDALPGGGVFARASHTGFFCPPNNGVNAGPNLRRFFNPRCTVPGGKHGTITIKEKLAKGTLDGTALCNCATVFFTLTKKVTRTTKTYSAYACFTIVVNRTGKPA